MTSPAVTVEPFWSIPGTAAIMSTHGVKRLPVIRREQLVGIVSRGDIVRAIARDDDQVRVEALDLVKFHQQLWSDPLPVDVSVVDGETTLTGAVERRTMADMLPELVGRIPGVINVRSELTWQDDDRPE
jgi:CBS domain-containing protein